jgi:uncharacterized protein YndB with AHSA1/START domain
MPRSIKQEVVIAADTESVYEALMDSRTHRAFTGAPARVSKKVGGAATCYDGQLSAVNVELEPGKRIVQAWRAKNWKAGVWSVVAFNLKKRGKTKTTLTFTQYGVPDDKYADINKGWKSHYWSKLNDYFSAKK